MNPSLGVFLTGAHTIKTTMLRNLLVALGLSLLVCIVRTAPLPEGEQWLIELDSTKNPNEAETSSNTPALSSIRALYQSSGMSAAATEDPKKFIPITIGNLQLVVAPTGNQDLKAKIQSINGVQNVASSQTWKLFESQSNPPWGLGTDWTSFVIRALVCTMVNCIYSANFLADSLKLLLVKLLFVDRIDQQSGLDQQFHYQANGGKGVTIFVIDSDMYFPFVALKRVKRYIITTILSLGKCNLIFFFFFFFWIIRLDTNHAELQGRADIVDLYVFTIYRTASLHYPK
jgi:hypothetical protein